MPLCSPCPIEQNTLALAPSVMRPRARADGPWGKQTRPLVQTHLRDLGLEGGMKGGCYKCHAQKAEVERGAAVQGSSCFRFHCRSKSNSRLWRSAEVNGHCHDPMALSSKKNPSVWLGLVCLGEGGTSSHVGVEGGTFCNGHCVGESSTPTHCFLWHCFSILLSHLVMSWSEPLSMEDNSGWNGLWL